MESSRPHTVSRHRPASTLLGALLGALLLGGAALAEGEVRVTARVVDESGNPVEGLTLILTSSEDNPARDTTTNKKGRATIPNLRSGDYTPSLDSGEWRILSIDFSARMADSSRKTFSETDVPGNGPPRITFVPFSRADLEIVVGESGAAAEASGPGIHGLADAQGELEVLNALFDLQRWDELIEKADELLAKDPELGGAHYLRGVALWRSGDFEEAEAAMARAQELIPDQPGIQGVIGAMLLEHANAAKEAGDDALAQELADRAILALDKQLQATPGVKTHLVNKVIALEIAGDPETTMAALAELIEIDPEDPRPYLRLAELQMEHGQAEEAVDTIASIPGAGAEVTDHLYNAAVAMYNEDKLDAAIATMVRAIEMAPESAVLHQLKGRAHIAKGETAEGIAELEEYIRLSPADADTSTEQKLIEALKQQG